MTYRLSMRNSAPSNT